MKTVFITCFFNLVVRNVLATAFFRVLKARKDLRLVLLVPEGKRDFFQKEFGGGNVVLEEVPFRKLSRINLFFHVWSWHLLSTRSKKIHKLVQLGKSCNYFQYFITSLIAWSGKFSLARRLFRWLDYRLVPGGGVNDLFEKYDPVAVFASDIQDLRAQEYSDTYFIREARRRGVFSVGMSRSWDSMSTKGLLRTLPDLLVVQSENIKDQAVQYHNVPADIIRVVGTPHYDFYLTGQRRPRADFFRAFGLDPAKKLVLVALSSDIWTGDSNNNPYLLEAFAGLDSQVIARFPIFGGVNLGDFKLPTNVVLDAPRHTAKLEEAFLSREDDEHLADLLYHSDVVVTGPSSIVLDAAIFGKPVVLVGFDGEKTKPLWASLRRYYEYEHQQAVICSGELKIAKNREELVGLIRHYLANPQDGQGGRQRVAEGVCYKLDGKSGERLAEVILENL